MIDRAMLSRLLTQIGTPEATVTEKGMELARAIFIAGAEEEREECAKLAESATAYTQFQTVEHYKIAAAIAAGIRRRSNASFSREPERSVGESAGSDSYGGNDD